MIKINLLPVDQRPVTRTAIPHVLSLLVLMAVLFFMSQTYLKLEVELAGINQRIAKQEEAKAQLDATVTEHEELQKQTAHLQLMVVTIQGILKDRTIWSEHLHQLMALTPDNIWYKRLRLTERRFTEEVPEVDPQGAPVIDPRTKKQKIKRQQVPRSILEVSGYAVDDEGGLSSTATLADNTTSDTTFSEKFQLFTSDFNDTEFDGYPVREFIFEYVIS
ncbi:MAG: hypothetical protein KAH38_02985 [Candidatus Hydrogenedentes bacterium]|nr:hypothetical protein [Candidatus Hydrogenedentota bacterium]